MSIRVQMIILALVIILSGLPMGCKMNGLVITNAWARPGTVNGNSAVFFKIENPINEADSLSEVTCNSADRAEIHRSIMEEGVMKMEHQESVEIPPNSSIDFEPGSYHVMLVNLTGDLKVGDTITLTLIFDNTGELALEIPVEAR
jgi:copper(I)-binding protein